MLAGDSFLIFLPFFSNLLHKIKLETIQHAQSVQRHCKNGSGISSILSRIIITHKCSNPKTQRHYTRNRNYGVINCSYYSSKKGCAIYAIINFFC